MSESAWDIFPAPSVQAEHRADGTVVLRNERLPDQSGTSLIGRLEHWAQQRPDRAFLSEEQDETRHSISYADFTARSRGLAARLLTLGVQDDRPIVICASNGINHALLVIAAMRAALTVAIVSPHYVSRAAQPWAKARTLIETLDPALVVADDPDTMALVLAGDRQACPVFAIADLGGLEAMPGAAEEIVAAAAVRADMDFPAKLLFTSGSTGAPKGVVNTQRMMTSNMEGLAAVWPFLHGAPPVLVDWLPWSHTFGGNCCFDLALWFGGTLHIDAGKPVAGLVDQSVRTLRAITPNLYFNVPGGYDALLPFLEQDAAFATAFLGELRLMFSAGAALPATTRSRLEAVCLARLGRIVPIVGGWGSTETAPFSTALYFPTPHANNLGVPLPGVEVKMVPTSNGAELRVRGPNVMPRYWRNPEITAEAFDDEGFYRMGDSGGLADAAHPEQGILFDGRVAENFKLLSGTWVNVSALRLAVIAAAFPYVADAVIVGEQRDEIGLLLFATDIAMSAGEELACVGIAERLHLYNADQRGSSTRVARFHLLREPPSRDHEEVTDKGYINQRAVLARRKAFVDILYEPTGAQGVHLLKTAAVAQVTA